MRTLDPYVAIVNEKFPKRIPIKETLRQSFNRDAVLFKEKKRDNYCYLELTSTTGKIQISFFNSDHIYFNDIETDYLINSITFEIRSVTMAKLLLGWLLPNWH